MGMNISYYADQLDFGGKFCNNRLFMNCLHGILLLSNISYSIYIAGSIEEADADPDEVIDLTNVNALQVV